MHIAIYSYKVADRKQMERLMEREADRWIKEGKPIYTYTFGSVESLFASTLTYDAVMVDMCETDTYTAKDIILKYEEDNVKTRVIECAYEMTIGESLDNNFFLPKDIKVSDLHETMLGLEEKIKTNKVKLEIRNENETIYLDEEELMYALQKGMKTDFHLTDGRVITVFGNAQALYYSMASQYPTLVFPATNAIVNVRYIDKIFLHKAYMKDGETIKIKASVIPYIKEVMTLLKDGSDEALDKLNNLLEK